jgi:hypothetical protein
MTQAPAQAPPAGSEPRAAQVTGPSPAWLKLRRRLAGVVFLAVLALLAWLSVALYNKQFTPVTLVTLYTDSVGNEMHQGAEVMVRGVQVGSVRQITAEGTGAQLELALEPSEASWLPANVSAEMLPTTLFGERYVDLILPAHRSAQTLAATRVISQNRSADAIELERVLNNLLPTLQAVEPDKLSVTLSTIAEGLQGRGAELGQTSGRPGPIWRSHRRRGTGGRLEGRAVARGRGAGGDPRPLYRGRHERPGPAPRTGDRSGLRGRADEP